MDYVPDELASPDLQHEILKELRPSRVHESVIDMRDESFAPWFRAQFVNDDVQSPIRNLTGGLHVDTLPDGKPNTYYDGSILGKHGTAYSSASVRSDVPPIEPDPPVDGVQDSPEQTEEPLVFVNGMNTTREECYKKAKAYSNISRKRVLCIYNATEGRLNDLIQAIQDKRGEGRNPAVETLTTLILDYISTGKSLSLQGESQGSIIITRALQDVQKKLREQGRSDAAIKELFSKLSITTIGGAVWEYVDGPQYTHYVNRYDPIAFEFGLARVGLSQEQQEDVRSYLNTTGWDHQRELIQSIAQILTGRSLPENPVLHPGEGAKVFYFEYKTVEWWEAHYYPMYLEHLSRARLLVQPAQLRRQQAHEEWR